MRLRWLLFDYVPPELGLSRAERRAVRKRANALRPSGMHYRGNLIDLKIILPLMALALVAWAVIDRFDLRFWYLKYLLFPIAGWIGTAYAYRRTHMPFVCQALRERGHEVCEQCSYVLRGLDETIERCPECGWVREKMERSAA